MVNKTKTLISEIINISSATNIPKNEIQNPNPPHKTITSKVNESVKKIWDGNDNYDEDLKNIANICPVSNEANIFEEINDNLEND